MRILMINSVCGIRSTGRICTDLAISLEALGHEVKIAYGRENVPDACAHFAVRIGNELSVKAHGALARVCDADGRGSVAATKSFIAWVEEYDPDVIHLHNLHGYYINTEILFDYLIRSGKRVVWTLHDMWAFTGHSCTCDQFGCEKWRSGCNGCPAYRGYPKSYVDRAKENFERKKKLFSALEDLTLVTPSKWLAGLVSESYLKGKRLEVIPNGVDRTQFHPMPNDFKSRYGIENKTLLMGCSTWWGPGKGLQDFFQLAMALDERFAVVLVGLDSQQLQELPKGVIGIQRTDSVQKLAEIYSAADLFLNLTYRDNYPTVNIEALACGTPVLTYKTGGSPECLDGHNGRAFEQGDVDGLVRFLSEEYRPGCFCVSPSPVLDKRTASEAYGRLLLKN